MMPKSSATYRPSGVTRMFPGCMSAWKNPSRNTWVKKISTPVRASFGMSTPWRRSSSTWLTGVPRILCMVMTVPAHQSQYTSGTTSSGESGKLRRNWLALAASRMRSSSSNRCRANSATTSCGFKRLPSAQKRSTRPAPASSSARSSTITGSIPGRRIFTAASVPPRSTARCTCATEALATGWGSNRSNSSPTGLPKARSTSAAASSAGNGGTRSWSFASSSARSAGTRSRRVESTWPNLMKMGPSASSARRSRAPRGSRSERKKSSAFSARASPLPEASANSSRPKRKAIQSIFASRSKGVVTGVGFERPIYQNRPARTPERDSGLAWTGKALYAFFQAGRVVAQRVDVAAELLHVGRPREEHLLLGPVLHQVLRETRRGLALPVREGLALGHEAMGEDVAEKPGKILFDVPDEVAKQVLHGAREIRRAFDFDFFQGGLVASEEERQCAGFELYDERARRFLMCPIDETAVQNPQAQIRKRRAAEFHALTREGPEPLGRPRLLREQMVQSRDGSALDHDPSATDASRSRAQLSSIAVSRRAASPRTRPRAFADSRSRRTAWPARPPGRGSSRRSARSPSAARLRLRAPEARHSASPRRFGSP